MGAGVARLEPFMARGRALRASGVTGDRVDRVRFREARAGRLALPRQPAALYSLTGTAGSLPWIMFPGTPKAAHHVRAGDVTARGVRALVGPVHPGWPLSPRLCSDDCSG